MIHEAKWLSRIGIVVPEGAQEVQLQEEKSVKMSPKSSNNILMQQLFPPPQTQSYCVTKCVHLSLIGKMKIPNISNEMASS